MMDAFSLWLPPANISPIKVFCHGKRALLFALQCRTAGTGKEEIKVLLAQG